jgi:hypothetical protein
LPTRRTPISLTPSVQRTAQGEDDSPLRFRRVLLVKPGLLVVDDLWGTPDANRTIRRVGWTAEPIVVASDSKGVPAGLDKLRWLETNDPVGNLRGARDAETGARTRPQRRMRPAA